MSESLIELGMKKVSAGKIVACGFSLKKIGMYDMLIYMFWVW